MVVVYQIKLFPLYIIFIMTYKSLLSKIIIFDYMSLPKTKSLIVVDSIFNMIKIIFYVF